MTRAEYPQPTEQYLRDIESAMPSDWHYVGKGCACIGSPLVYSVANLKIEVWAMRKHYRVKRNNVQLHTGMLHTKEDLTNLLAKI